MPGCMAWNRPRHITDQGKVAAHDMPLIAGKHLPDKLFYAPLSVLGEHTSKRRAKMFIHLRIKLIDPLRQYTKILLFVL